MNKMECITVLKANFRRQKGSFSGVFVLIFIITMSLATVLSIWQNSNVYIEEEMERMRFGDITAWVSGVHSIEKLTSHINSISEVQHAEIQRLIYSKYSINGKEADTEGQLISYEPKEYPYKIFTDDLLGYREDEVIIEPGEIYVSPSLSSLFNIKIGDEVNFSIARRGVEERFIVKGFFEDPFMGSSMIEMKSFLICDEDRIRIEEMSENAENDSLIDIGAMIHIFQREKSNYSISEFNQLLNEETDLPNYVEFTHVSSVILGFMLILQNIFVGFLMVFVVILIGVSMIVLGHSINSSIEQDYVNMGILKTIGFTSSKLRNIQIIQYLICIICGMVLGVITSIWLIGVVNRMTITTIGVLIPSNLSVKMCVLTLIAMIYLFISFIYIKTIKIGKITPLSAIREGVGSNRIKGIKISTIHKKGLNCWIALRQVITGKKQYGSVFIITILLVFLISLIGRINAWLGSDGVGLMNAFNPAEVHIGVERIENVSEIDIESTISSYTAITDKYQFSMPTVSVNGIDYTVNVISDPQKYNILEGRSCINDNEIVITEFVAESLNVIIGDTLVVSFGSKSKDYVVSGIYQCANDMGDNIGMSSEGFYAIGDDSKIMWCTHYLIDDISQKNIVLEELKRIYGGNIQVHENSWSGLEGIIAAMKGLTIFMYVIAGIVIFVVIILTGNKILYVEQKDMAIYKSLGFSSNSLRLTFAIRFGIVSIMGSFGGILLSSILTDSIVSSLLKLAGISNFNSKLPVESMIMSVGLVTGLFVCFAYIISRKIKNGNLSTLIVE